MATKRPDLAAVDANPGFLYVGLDLAPAFAVQGKSGTVYYQTVDADVAAQTGRNPGAAPNVTLLANQSTTFAAAEAIDRTAIPDDDVDLVAGDLARAQIKAAKKGKRAILRAQEDAIITALTALCTEAHGNKADILGSFRIALDTGLDFIHRVPGKTVLACGWTTYRRLTRFAEITGMLLRMGVITEAQRGQIWTVAAPILAAAIGVDEVLIGDDDHWTAGMALLAKRPNPAMDPNEEPQIARTITYWPRSGQPFECESYLDDHLKTEVVDTRSWYQVKGFDWNGIYYLRGIDEGNAITTTTSTTTA